jgi:hypothetical protein
MSKNFYEEGFPDDDPTDELPILTDVAIGGDEEQTEAFRTLPVDEDTGRFEQPDVAAIPTLEDRDETATELVRDIADRDAKLAALESELAKLELRWRQTSDDLTTRDSELAAARAALAELEAGRQGDRDALALAREQVRVRDDRIAALETELESARDAAVSLEENVHALEQQFTELEAEHERTVNATASGPESPVTIQLREEVAALAGHIESRNSIWRQQIAEVADKSNRIRELEIELAQRVAAQSEAERLAGLESERARDYRDRLVSATAALDATRVQPGPGAAPKPAAASAPRDDSPPADSDDRLAAELERAVALQQSAGNDAESLRRLEELELAIRELEKNMDEAAVDAPAPEPETIPPQLVCLTGEAPEIHSLDDGDTVIGRGSDCAIRLMTHYVSREHARIATSDGQSVLEDLGSRNGVFVNSVRIDRQALGDDDLITIGDTQFRFRAARRVQG